MLFIKYNVARGDIFAPLLFNTYINVIIKAPSLLHFILYGHETSVFSPSNDINTLMNTLNVELTNICAWLEANHLSLNSDKTSHFIFHRRK